MRTPLRLVAIGIHLRQQRGERVADFRRLDRDDAARAEFGTVVHPIGVLRPRGDQLSRDLWKLQRASARTSLPFGDLRILRRRRLHVFRDPAVHRHQQRPHRPCIRIRIRQILRRRANRRKRRRTVLAAGEEVDARGVGYRQILLSIQASNESAPPNGPSIRRPNWCRRSSASRAPARALSRMPPVSPVSGSVSGLSVKGKMSVG